MRWPVFAILAYLIIAIHMALSGFLRWGEAAPNLVLPVVVFIAINARRQEALSSAFILGALQDLFVSQQPVGLYAFSYGLAALFIVGTQPAVYRDHPLTHVFVTFAAAIAVGVVIMLNESMHQRDVSMWRLVAGAIYTALLAPVMLGGFVRVKRAFGFRPIRLYPGGERQTGYGMR